MDEIDRIVDSLLESKPAYVLKYRLPDGSIEEFDTAETEQEAADKLEACPFDADDIWYEETNGQD